MNVLLVIIFATFAFLAWKNLRVAFYVFIAALPAYLIRFSISGVPITALEAMFIILFVFWLLKREKRLIDIRGWRIMLLLWVVVATVSLFVASDFRAAAGVWKAYFIEPILFFLIANDLLRTENDREVALKALAGTAIVIGVTAIVQRFTGWGVPPPFNGIPIPPSHDAQFRSTVFYGFPNAVGLFLAPLIPLFLARWKTWLFSLAAILSGIAVVLAQSEGAIVGVAAGVLFMGLMHAKTRKPVAAIAILGFALLMALPMTRPTVIQKLTISDDSGRVRRLIWGETWSMLKDRPIFGAGLSGYPVVFDKYHEARYIEIFQYPHNAVLNFWSEVGFFGMLLYFLTILQVFLASRRLCKKNPETHALTIAVSAAFIVILVHGIVDVPYFKNDLSMQFWLLIALLASTAAEMKKE